MVLGQHTGVGILRNGDKGGVLLSLCITFLHYYLFITFPCFIIHPISVPFLMLCFCSRAGERQAEAGDGLRDDAPLRRRHVAASPARIASLQLRHTHQLPRTRVRLQGVSSFPFTQPISNL